MKKGIGQFGTITLSIVVLAMFLIFGYYFVETTQTSLCGDSYTVDDGACWSCDADFTYVTANNTCVNASNYSQSGTRAELASGYYNATRTFSGTNGLGIVTSLATIAILIVIFGGIFSYMRFKY